MTGRSGTWFAIKGHARIAQERDGTFDPLHDGCEITGGNDLVAVFVEAPAKETNIGCDVIYDVGDIHFVKISAACVLDSRVTCFIQPSLEVLERRLARTGRERVVLFTWFPGDPRRSFGTLAIGTFVRR